MILIYSCWTVLFSWANWRIFCFSKENNINTSTGNVYTIYLFMYLYIYLSIDRNHILYSTHCCGWFPLGTNTYRCFLSYILWITIENISWDKNSICRVSCWIRYVICMYVCMCVCIYVCMYCMCVCVCVYVYMYVCNMYVCKLHMYLCVCIYEIMNVHVCMYVRTYICMYVCILSSLQFVL